MNNKDLAHRGILLLTLILFVVLSSPYFYRAAKASTLSINAIEVAAAKYNTPTAQPTSAPTQIPSLAPTEIPSLAPAEISSPAPYVISLGQVEAQPATQPGTVTLDQMPTSLDEAWYWIENGEHGMVFDIACPSLSSTPFVNWEMAELLAHNEAAGRRHPNIQVDAAVIAAVAAQGNMTFSGSGVITRSEDEVTVELIGLLESGSIQICGQGKPTLYGNGLQDFLNWLAQ
jgi:hypothetical protein